MRLVLIEWLDSVGCSSEWRRLEVDHPQPLTCRSVGWLVHDGDECKVIVPHVTEATGEEVTRQGCGDMTIPTKAILSVTELPLTNHAPLSKV